MIEKLSLEYGSDRPLETWVSPPIEVPLDAQREFNNARQPQCIKLDLENLKCFEVVAHQFEERGVIFTNAIALQPSNPAFPPHSGSIVLMGGPRNGWMEATFKQPVCWVSCFVTSSRQTVLSAYDRQDRLLGKVEIPESNLAGSGSTIEPNTQLCLQAPNIHRVTFYAFDGQFSLDDFQVCFQSE
ncbi:MAG: hypothetical protein F6K32_14775 [Desertifilum sp. SIO1I2]|nr:hypothetical protein [Desertifilum sp. SIO1I2]